MNGDDPWLLPELDRSFKQVFCVQCVFTSIGVGVVWYSYGALTGVTALVIVGLAWCIIVWLGIRSARTRTLQEEAREAMRNQKLGGTFAARESRLLDRTHMDIQPQYPPPTAALPPPEDYGK